MVRFAAFAAASVVHLTGKNGRGGSTAVGGSLGAKNEESTLLFLDEERPVKCERALEFERQGHLFWPNLFTKSEMDVLVPIIEEAFRDQELEALRQKVDVFLGEGSSQDRDKESCLQLLSQVDPDDIPFLQVFNMWRKPGPFQSRIEKLVKSRRLCGVAAKLLGTSAVRLYQDSTFLKRSGDGCTNWHSDLAMAPFDTNHMVTVWIPTSEVLSEDEGGTALCFASGSHRDFALGFWGDQRGADLGSRYIETPYPSFELGDAGWHHGWVLHAANANVLETPRLAFAVSYVAPDCRLLSDSARQPDDEDAWSYMEWKKGMESGAAIEGDHPFLPLIEL